MLDINLIREKPDWIKEQFRNLNAEDVIPRIDTILELDKKRREIRTEIETAQGFRNQLNKANGQLRGNKQMDDAEKATRAYLASEAIELSDYPTAVDILTGEKDVEEDDTQELTSSFDQLINALKALGTRLDDGFKEAKDIEAELETHMLWLPNIPHESVKVGMSEDENIIHKAEGMLFEFDFEPKPHWELGPELGILDLERGVKLAGTRSYILQGWGARLQRALTNFYLDMAREKGFIEVYVPHLLLEDMLYGSAQLPKFDDNVYRLDDSNQYLIPTAEVAITNMHRDEILDEAQLPLYYVGHTPCYRSEKMSAGRDVRGIKRVHQFDKVEMYKFTTPETSYDELESMTEAAADLCRALKIPFRRLEQVTGDLGFSATKKYDLEMYAPGCDEWLEVSSCSNTEDFQARRAMIRYRPVGSNNKRFVHTLNGSGLALPRTIIAILENYQQADGSVVIPDVLSPYLGGADVITKA